MKKGSSATNTALRLMIITQIKHGASPDRIAQQQGISRKTIYRWQATEKRHGMQALREHRAPPGRPPRLSTKQVFAVYQKGCVHFSENAKRWTAKLLMKAILEEHGVAYTDNWGQDLLKKCEALAVKQVKSTAVPGRQ